MKSKKNKIRLKKGNKHAYIGKAGHLYVMSELLLRGWNVAMPEVDTGDDIFVVQDKEYSLRRVQVKTATSKKNRDKSLKSQFSIKRPQLVSPSEPELIYILVTLLDNYEKKIIIISRDKLYDVYNNHSKQKTDSNHVTIPVLYKVSPIVWKKDLSDYESFETLFPDIKN